MLWRAGVLANRRQLRAHPSAGWRGLRESSWSLGLGSPGVRWARWPFASRIDRWSCSGITAASGNCLGHGGPGLVGAVVGSFDATPAEQAWTRLVVGEEDEPGALRCTSGR